MHDDKWLGMGLTNILANLKIKISRFPMLGMQFPEAAWSNLINSRRSLSDQLNSNPLHRGKMLNLYSNRFLGVQPQTYCMHFSYYALALCQTFLQDIFCVLKKDRIFSVYWTEPDKMSDNVRALYRTSAKVCHSQTCPPFPMTDGHHTPPILASNSLRWVLIKCSVVLDEFSMGLVVH